MKMKYVLFAILSGFVFSASAFARELTIKIDDSCRPTDPFPRLIVDWVELSVPDVIAPKRYPITYSEKINIPDNTTKLNFSTGLIYGRDREGWHVMYGKIDTKDLKQLRGNEIPNEMTLTCEKR